MKKPLFFLAILFLVNGIFQRDLFPQNRTINSDVSYISKQEQTQLKVFILKNPNLYRTKKITEYKYKPYFYSIRCWFAEGQINGEFIRIYLNIATDNSIVGILTYQSCERGFLSYFTEPVTRNISESLLQKIKSAKSMSPKFQIESDAFFVHIFEVKGSIQKDGGVKFGTNSIEFDRGFEQMSFDFHGKLDFLDNGKSSQLVGLLIQKELFRRGVEVSDKIQISSPLIASGYKDVAK